MYMFQEGIQIKRENQNEIFLNGNVLRNFEEQK